MCVFFSYVTGLQSKFPYFNKKRPQQKVFPVSFVRKQSKGRHFIKVAGLLLRFYKPLKGTRHTKFPEECLVFSGLSSLSNVLTITILNTDSTGNIFCEFSEF